MPAYPVHIRGKTLKWQLPNLFVSFSSVVQGRTTRHVETHDFLFNSEGNHLTNNSLTRAKTGTENLSASLALHLHSLELVLHSRKQVGSVKT